MAYSYDEMQGDAQPAHMGSQSNAGGEMQMADATVTKLHPPGTFAKNALIGDVLNGVANTVGVSPPNNVTPMKKIK
jgi:hypothetical protein